jgi:hypothetical protein
VILAELNATALAGGIVLFIVGALFFVATTGQVQLVKFEIDPDRRRQGEIVGAIVMIAGAALGLAAFFVGGGTTKGGAERSPSTTGLIVTSASSAIATTTSTATTAPQPVDGPVLYDGVTLSVTCAGFQPELRAGDDVELTLTVTTETVGQVGLGASLYPLDGEQEYSDDAHDVESVLVRPGQSPITRSFVVPNRPELGRYDLLAEVWPGGEIGDEGVDTLAEASCGEVELVG